MVVRGSACGAAIRVSRRSTPASSIVVTKVCAQHVGEHPGDAYPGDLLQAVQQAGGGVPVHPAASPVQQDRSERAVPMARSKERATAGHSGDEKDLVAVADDPRSTSA